MEVLPAPAVPNMMYGYGDTKSHYQATVDLVEVRVSAEGDIGQSLEAIWRMYGLHRPF